MTEVEKPQRYYSPNQIAVAAFLGGPVAAGFYLGKRYRFFGEEEQAWRCWKLSFIGMALLGLVLPFTASHIPNTIIPIIYTVLYSTLARTDDHKRGVKAQDMQADKGSTDKLLFISLVILAATVAFWLAIFWLLSQLNITVPL